MVRSCDSLTQSVVNGYGNRKIFGRLSVLVDVSENLIYPLPRDLEHIEFVKAHFSELAVNNGTIVPSHIQLEMTSSGLEEVIGIITGVSGMEIGYGIRHDRIDLEKAHAAVLEFVNNGEFSISSHKQDKIEYKYAAKWQ